jgi:hypothetical protein
VRLENDIKGMYEVGGLLIVQKGTITDEKEKLAYDKQTRKLLIMNEVVFDPDRISVVGDIIEERFNDCL